MNEPTQIKNPSITLYPFHQRNDGDESYQQPAKNAQDIWQTLADNVGEKFNFSELKSLRNKLICYKDGQYHSAGEDGNLSDQKLLLPKGKTLNFQPLTLPDNLILNGSIFARRIHDTYAAELTFCYNNATISVADLKQLNPQGCLLPNKIQASIGQTLLLYAEPVVYDDCSALADKCVRAFVGESIWPELTITATGKLFGSPIFEYDNPAKKCHILVWLTQYPQFSDRVTTDFNYYLINLLYNRSKILFLYNQAEQSYRLGQQIANKLEKLLPEFTKIEAEPNRKAKLTKLKSLLAAIRSLVFDYGQEVRHLREFSITTESNADNYSESYAKIKALSIAGDDLQFLQKFRRLSDRKYQSQIQKYLNYLIANKNWFQQTISTIRGMVEIEQVELDAEQDNKERKRDRQLENIIFFIGTAIGSGEIFAAAYPLIKDTPIKWQPDSSLPLHPFTATIVWSLLFGLGLGGLILVILGLVRKIFPKP